MQQESEILIAEDSPTQAAQLQHILTRHGYRTTVADNGRKALDLLSGNGYRPTLIISDIVMPEMDGYTFCHEIKADAQLKEIPVMLLTSLSDPHDIIRGLECGADNFLTKPYEEKQLLARVQYILLNREIRRGERTQTGMEVFFGGQRLVVTPERQQILDLLISTYETAVQKNLELQQVQDELRTLNESLEEKVEERTAELRVQKEFLREVIDTNPNIIYVKDEQGKYTLVNKALADLYGTPAERIIGETSATFIGEEENERYRQQDRTAMETLQTQFIPEESYTDVRTNEVRLFEIIKTPLISPDGQCNQLLVIATETTERKRTEDALRQSEEQLRQSQKLEAVGQLAGGLAHDFNNLLTVINGYSDLLLRSINDLGQRQKVEEVKRAGDRGASLIRQLLAFSRKQILQPSVLNLNQIVPNVDKMLRRLIGEDIDFLTVLEPELGQVKADVGQIEQVLVNLAVNARDAMPTGGKLTVETSNVYLDEAYARTHLAVTPGHYVMLEVSDTGTGMDAETQKHIFVPFFTTKEEGKGTGLGLATVYGIVKQSDGFLWVYSEVGRGTSFKIYLPRVYETVEQQALEALPALTPQGAETILLVEDEAAVRQLVQDVLEVNGYRVMAAASGREALALLEHYSEPIHLLMTDVVMPQMDGREVAEQFTLLRPQTRVLYISGYTDEVIVHHGVLNHEVAFLQKPFAPETIARKVREVLDAAPALSLIAGESQGRSEVSA